MLKVEEDGRYKSSRERLKQHISCRTDTFDSLFWNYASQHFVKRVLKHIPDFYNYRTLLYVGMRIVPMRMYLCPEFAQLGYIIDVMEISPTDVADIIEWNKTYRLFRNVIEGDIRKVDDMINEKYDQIFWWHGPECIKKKEISVTLNKLMKVVTKMAVVGCPDWDFPYEQLGSGFRNLYENHQSWLLEKDFQRWGWNVAKLGVFRWLSGRQLLVWRRPPVMDFLGRSRKKWEESK